MEPRKKISGRDAIDPIVRIGRRRAFASTPNDNESRAAPPNHFPIAIRLDARATRLRRAARMSCSSLALKRWRRKN